LTPAGPSWASYNPDFCNLVLGMVQPIQSLGRDNTMHPSECLIQRGFV